MAQIKQSLNNDHFSLHTGVNEKFPFHHLHARDVIVMAALTWSERRNEEETSNLELFDKIKISSRIVARSTKRLKNCGTENWTTKKIKKTCFSCSPESHVTDGVILWFFVWESLRPLGSTNIPSLQSLSDRKSSAKPWQVQFGCTVMRDEFP